ncbi:G-type lectin S-receptor-like serine/threonine-protein kinase At2g19130 [Cryptomeria japonica]|uniref:G-type lectin S-receptor-like serine/threonine-protein kinase At2g19130 n=1 Tax=Cryptomeria japonica TaxID=3369 RepID=UPI0027DA84D2|nr:G-type lectin S-receptor-like serine/threonine-protein kinase At2g19130 [Cryptomeria japonica]
MKTHNAEMGRNGALAYMLFALTVITVFHNCDKCTAAVGGDTLSLGTSLTGNQTIISKNGTFEIGFFRPDGTDNWYIGIWYGKVAEKTIVWVANRDRPAKKRPGVFMLSKQGSLGLFDSENVSLWSANISNKASRAVILDSGNFLMVSDGSNSETVWQSFDYPVDTWLPGMRVGGKRELVCWKNSLDPATGIFSKRMDPSGISQFVLIWNNSVKYWESGVWDGESFIQIPEMTLNDLFNYRAENTTSGFYISYELRPPVNVLTRFVLQRSGVLQLYALFDNTNWSVVWSQPTDECSVYGICGAYGNCNSNNVDFCGCVEGFIPRDNRSWKMQDWSSSGCVRKSPLNCDTKNGSSDRFMGYNVTLPVNQAFTYPARSNEDCQKACLQNCSCNAFSFIGPSGTCQTWSGNLINMHTSPLESNSDVFIRLAASPISKFDHKLSSSRRKTAISIMGTVLGIVGTLTIVFCFFSFSMWRSQRLLLMQMRADSSNSFLSLFSYKELKIATRNFGSRLGSGGFGSVFKGTLTDGTLVAVKKLEESRGDEKQFRAEISSLGNIQHLNLVRLRGFCAEGSQRLLVYDYMPNGSLNSLLFSSNNQSKLNLLNWKTRFQIALGTARGLFYLQEECRECIIHNDVKPENILLDSEFSPKLADFGMAKLVGRDFSRVLTTMRGTRGYLAPEWLSGLPIIPKVDVHSYGKTLFEIISGRRNLDMSVQDSKKHYFPTWAAAQIYQGNTIDIVEEGVVLAEKADIEEARRAIVVALLCIEEDENVRPSMRQVLQMLEGKMELPTPHIPIDSDGDVVACNNPSEHELWSESMTEATTFSV